METDLSRPLMELEGTVGEALSLGKTHAGERRLIPITGGRFAGRITGRILPGGADWQLIRHDGVADIAAHYVLQTDGGALIEVRSEGYRHGPAEVIASLARGEPVDPGEYYFRTLMRFETGDSGLEWLNRVLALAWGQRLPGKVLLRVMEVL